MNNRITQLFKRKKTNILSVFFTAGYPAITDTCRIIKALEDSGADMIEIGIPFSDPLADGPVIQKSSAQALQNGMTLERLFNDLKDIRKQVDIPLVLMGYLNPVIRFGMEKFIMKCCETGIDGVILPDLPPAIYRDQYVSLFEQNNISNVFLITPETDSKRIKEIDDSSEGFIYMVSSSSTTGGTAVFNSEKYKAVKEMQLRNPFLIGFGVSDAQTFENVNRYANGAVIGSAFINAISAGNIEEKIPEFISSILNHEVIL